MQGFLSETNRKIIFRTIQYLQKFAWELITAFVPALLIALVINVQVAKAVEIESGPSMQPNMYQGYRLMIEKEAIDFTCHSEEISS